jgi:hypothetical protein
MKRVSTPPSPAGEHKQIEEWAAPDLDCFPLVQTITQSLADGMQYKTIRTVTFVVTGEPAESLFTVPENYVERSPAETAVEFSRRYPGRSVAGSETLSRAEDRYRKQQQPQ